MLTNEISLKGNKHMFDKMDDRKNFIGSDKKNLGNPSRPFSQEIK